MGERRSLGSTVRVQIVGAGVGSDRYDGSTGWSGRKGDRRRPPRVHARQATTVPPGSSEVTTPASFDPVVTGSDRSGRLLPDRPTRRLWRPSTIAGGPMVTECPSSRVEACSTLPCFPLGPCRGHPLHCL